MSRRLSDNARPSASPQGGSTQETAAHASSEPASHPLRRLLILTIGALGVVYGDIGTSPLYAFRECFYVSHAVTATPENVIGVLSLILWTLIVVVTLKYLVYVLRADNRGEGGVLALMALVVPQSLSVRGRRPLLAMLGLFGAALLYGDGMITPAISVLSAVEGLEVATPLFRPYVIPVAIGILLALFSFQRFGTATVGAVFGPVMLIWFSCIAALGVSWIVRAPEVLAAFHPGNAVHFFVANRVKGFAVLGAIFLVATGSEALYADMGHFGRGPIRLGWASVAFPALTMNYLGQGALLLARPDAIANPFFMLAPATLLYPLVVLATVATVIASQAIISGAFSLTRQAIQLGYLPRMAVRHSSPEEVGQIYVPVVNWTLMFATIALVLGFGSSGNLAGAYGIAVSMTMALTTLLVAFVARRRWRWPLISVGAMTCMFLAVDLAYFGANSLKIVAGGWVPLAVAALVYLVMSTWNRGVSMAMQFAMEAMLSVEDFLQDLERHPVLRVPGTAVFLTTAGTGIPRTLLHNLKHNKVLHENIILLTIVTDDVPRVALENRIAIERYRPDFLRIIVHYGFMESPDIPRLLAWLRSYGVDLDPMNTTYFFGRENYVVGGAERPGANQMARWRKYLFAWMARNAYRAQEHFQIPANQVVEIGAQVTL